MDKINIRKCKPQGLCIVCGEPKSDARMEVQVNIFRGDDDVYKIHWKCRHKARGKING